MPRSATDATRFTSTIPHQSKAQLPSKGLPPRKPAPPSPPGETPQQKVRRLRAAADAARDAQITTFDKVIVRGRVWADRAHKFVTLSLIAATVVAGGVTVYALGDMMIYNRKKRAQFFEEQKAIHANAIYKARLAIDDGTATEEDIKFISREDEHAAQLEALARAKTEKKGIFKRGKEWLFSGLKKEEEGENVGSSERRLGYEALSEEDDTLGERESDIVRAIEDKKMAAISVKAKQAFAEEKEKQRNGGPLDRIGTKPQDDDEPKHTSWTSFLGRR
ncbi:cytochrome oxidase c assembly-domain-containing protein [Leptodontidium sp. MPI-SDFR-AT-0119]|nr:cytochrome oxidase c assembly-domain-containing protein [Leptodontidium sp. MPI-SDFR-AT-0119]